MTRRFLAAACAALLLVSQPALAARAMPKAGDVPPDKVGITLGGDPVLLSQHAGKAVVISFWATWCGYCMKELPILSRIHEVSKGKVDVIAINVEDRDTFHEVRRNLRNLQMELAYDPHDEAQQAYGVDGIPHMVIIGRDGKITAVYRGYGEAQLPDIADDINHAIAGVPAEPH